MLHKKRIWIPIVLLIVGISLVAYSFKNVVTTFQSINTNDSINSTSFTERTESFDPNKGIDITVNDANVVTVLFEEREDAILTVRGNLEEFQVLDTFDETKIRTSNHACTKSINFLCKEAPIDFIILRLPLSFQNSIEIDGAQTDIVMKSETPVSLQKVDIDILNTTLEISNIHSDFDIEGMNIHSNLNNISGNYKVDALSSTQIINKLSPLLNVSMSGMNSNITINAAELSYKINAEGLHTDFNDILNKKTSNTYFSGLRLQEISNNPNAPLITLELEGLNNNITIKP